MSKEPEDDADPLAEGFRNPPERVTGPCLTYIARIMELREFIYFYFSFVKTSQELGSLIPRKEQEAASSQQSHVLVYNYSRQRPLVNQIMLSRAVKLFDLYLTTILRDIFLARPEMLKSEGTIDISMVIETANYEDLIWQIVEKKGARAILQAAFALRKFIISRIGIDLFPTPNLSR